MKALQSVCCAALAVGALFVCAHSAAALDPAPKCEAAKAKEAGKYGACRLSAVSKGVKKAIAPDFTKCEAKFGLKWSKIEAKGAGACPSNGDEASINADVTAHGDRIALLVSGGTPLDCAFAATGQTTSYASGDDGAVMAGAVLAYTDNGDGTVTDRNTGLTWEKKIAADGSFDGAELHDADNCYPWEGSCSASAGTCGTDADCPGGETCDVGDCQTANPDGLTIFEWAEALNAASFAGHSDWRVPNTRELASIVDYGTSSPGVDVAFNGASCGAACTDMTDPSCSCTASDIYWASSTIVGVTSSAWTTNFFFGSVGLANKTGVHMVRAVRGGL